MYCFLFYQIIADSVWVLVLFSDCFILIFFGIRIIECYVYYITVGSLLSFLSF